MSNHKYNPQMILLDMLTEKEKEENDGEKNETK